MSNIPESWKITVNWGEGDIETIQDSKVSDVLSCAVWSFLTEPPAYCNRPAKYNNDWDKKNDS